MSTFVLKREYALAMPTSYVDIDRDEMEYVDGGAKVTTIVPYVNIYVKLSARECGDIAAKLAGGGATAASIAGVLGLTGYGISAAIALTIASGIMGLGSAYMWYCSNANGFYYNYRLGLTDLWGRIN